MIVSTPVTRYIPPALPAMADPPRAGAEVGRRSTPVGATLACVFVPPAPCPAGSIAALGVQLVVGRDFPEVALFPEAWAGWCWTVHHAFAEAQISRLAGGWSLNAPFHGAKLTVCLPGERAFARCAYIYPDGSWEGVLETITVNEMTDQMIDHLNGITSAAGTPLEMVRGRHALRCGHLVTFRLDAANMWVTDQRSGGLA